MKGGKGSGTTIMRARGPAPWLATARSSDDLPTQNKQGISSRLTPLSVPLALAVEEPVSVSDAVMLLVGASLPVPVSVALALELCRRVTEGE